MNTLQANDLTGVGHTKTLQASELVLLGQAGLVGVES